MAGDVVDKCSSSLRGHNLSVKGSGLDEIAVGVIGSVSLDKSGDLFDIHILEKK